MFTLFTILGLPLYAIGLKNMILNTNYVNKGLIPSFGAKMVFSYCPTIVLLVVCLVYPDVTKVYMSFGMTIWSLNGYIYPFIL